MSSKVIFLLLTIVSPQAVAATDYNAWQQTWQDAVTWAPELKTLSLLTVLSFVPVMLIAVTAFTRIIIVLSMLRHALGLPQTPPNVVLLTLALFLTLYCMQPVWQQIDEQAVQPYHSQLISLEQALDNGIAPLKSFMVSQTRESNFAAVYQMAKTPLPASAEEVSLLYLIPAFLLSELTTAFQIAFVIFIPFLLIDLIVASVLMSLGMIMVPPISIALPIKVMVFVLIDGWSLVTQSLVSSFS
ncbi:flagellar type III secretion system pore protein FliP [Arsukibacterium perlucidum]|uniref:flagellar type III secretion system pore protein FliP n=1 Tax=Arsukibacterium perlucidum TaxID=368811 RepID=UPI00035DC860|nr:flagellar type III secretion system pore protein FliP [Arsukibacterium perlucidum]